MLTVVWLAVMPHSQHAAGDAVFYQRMAADPKAPGNTPYAFRVLTPWLAHLLGGGTYPGYAVAFRVLTASSLAAAGVAAYLICRRLGGVHAAGLVGMAGLLSLPGWLFNLYQPYLIDPMAMALTAWSMTAVVYGWLAAVPLLLTVMGLARETVAAFLLPIYMWLRTRWIDVGVAWRILLMAGPALLATWAVRQPMVLRGWPTTMQLLQVGWKISYRDRIGHDLGLSLLVAFAASLGMWWVLAGHGWRRGGRLLWLLVPVFAQFLVGADWSRFALYAFPVVIPVAAMTLWEHPRRLLLLGLATTQSLAIIGDLVWYGRPWLNRATPSVWISAGVMVATALVVWLPRPRPAAKPLPGGPAAG